jgi:hypothetical protein
MSQSELIINFESLTDFFDKESLPYQVDKDNQKVLLPTKFHALESELLILWDKDSSLIQCIHPLPFQVPESRIAAAESAISWINHVLMLPGFGLNHASRFLYYRLSIPRREDGAISVKELQQLVQTAISTAADFYLPLSRVILENLDPQLVVDEASQKSSEN